MSTPVSITIHNAFLPHNDKDASLAFYRDLLGFEVRNDVGYNGMHWITVGHPDQPGMSLVLHPPAADPGEPIEQPYGVRDCAVRDPAGNLLRINEVQNKNSDS
jgi:catechol 2,3-dioxygenase-like lactoylglutathione lyase family enzyme